MRYVLLFLLLSQTLISKERYVAIRIRDSYKGEISFAHRIKAAAENLGWTVDVTDFYDRKQARNKYDFVISLVPGYYKKPKCNNYLAIFHPSHHYFDRTGKLKKRYLKYQGYLLTYHPTDDDPNFKQAELPHFFWYPSTQKMAYSKVDPTHLYYLCSEWGDRYRSEKFQKILSHLDKEPFTKLYGVPRFKEIYPNSYQGHPPYDATSLYEIARNAGISLVFHSSDHNKFGIPSGRIFEATASGTVVISDKNSFVKQNFGDSVFYIDTSECADSITYQIEKHIAWIEANKEEALKKAKVAYEINQKSFSLEKQLVKLGEFHDELTRSFFQKAMDRLSTFFKMPKAPNPVVLSSPISTTSNTNEEHSLINSVDFHPNKSLIVSTITYNDEVALYRVGDDHQMELAQKLQNPLASLSCPQHAVFTHDGNNLVVVNWKNQTINLYGISDSDHFSEKPLSITPFPEELKSYRPHGAAFSPCGTYFALALGASSRYGRGISLFKKEGTKFELIHLIKDEYLKGTPKGITFSPNGQSLLVSFCGPDYLATFNVEDEKICTPAKQTVQNKEISRPEDIKITRDGKYVAISNSDQGNISFIPFDSKANSILEDKPIHSLTSRFQFPHGIAFSPVENYLAVTEFGRIQIMEKGDIKPKENTRADEAKISLFIMK